jgi:hypothetical protein
MVAKLISGMRVERQLTKKRRKFKARIPHSEFRNKWCLTLIVGEDHYGSQAD